MLSSVTTTDQNTTKHPVKYYNYLALVCIVVSGHPADRKQLTGIAA